MSQPRIKHRIPYTGPGSERICTIHVYTPTSNPSRLEPWNDITGITLYEAYKSIRRKGLQLIREKILDPATGERNWILGPTQEALEQERKRRKKLDTALLYRGQAEKAGIPLPDSPTGRHRSNPRLQSLPITETTTLTDTAAQDHTLGPDPNTEILDKIDKFINKYAKPQSA